MKKKIVIIFAVLAIILFSYYILQGSHFKKTLNIEPKKEQPVDDSKNASDNNASQTSNNSAAIESAAIESAANIEVTPKDCDNDCSKFKKSNEKEYCQEICGTETYFEDANDSGGTSDDCGNEKGIQKDYCLKDIAIGNKDFKACDEIADANIKKSCRNRITEDLIESQNSAENLL